MSFNQALKRLIGKLPPKDFLKDKLAEYTPDLHELETQGFQRLFVSDEMMVGHRKHEELLNAHSVCLTAAFTQNQFCNVLHKRGVESYSAPFKEVLVGVKPAAIKGELFAVLSSQFKELDNYKKNGVEFIRERIKIVVPTTHVQENGETTVIDNQEHIELMDAWFYRAQFNFFCPFLDGGYEYCPISIYKDKRDWLREFSYFSQKEYEKY
jgi:hypothetical protein